MPPYCLNFPCCILHSCVRYTRFGIHISRLHFFSTIYLAGIKVIFPLAMITQTISMYLTVFAALDVFISSWFMQFRTRYCRKRVAFTMIFGVVAISAIFNTSRFWEIDVVDCVSNGVRVKSEVCPTDFRMNPDYNDIYHVYFTAVFSTVGPLLLLVFSTLVSLCRRYFHKNGFGLKIIPPHW